MYNEAAALLELMGVPVLKLMVKSSSQFENRYSNCAIHNFAGPFGLNTWLRMMCDHADNRVQEGEAEAQCAQLNAMGLVDACITKDADGTITIQTASANYLLK